MSSPIRNVENYEAGLFEEGLVGKSPAKKRAARGVDTGPGLGRTLSLEGSDSSLLGLREPCSAILLEKREQSCRFIICPCPEAPEVGTRLLLGVNATLLFMFHLTSRGRLISPAQFDG